MSTQPVPTFFIPLENKTFDKIVEETLAGEGDYTSTFNFLKNIKFNSSAIIEGEFSKFVTDDDMLTYDWAAIKKLEAVCLNEKYDNSIRQLAQSIITSILYEKFYIDR